VVTDYKQEHSESTNFTNVLTEYISYKMAYLIRPLQRRWKTDPTCTSGPGSTPKCSQF